MSRFMIKGNALEFQTLMSCIEASPGAPGQNFAKAEVHDRILATWPEFDSRRNKPRIDDQSAEALKVRTMQLDSEEQGALAETFLAAVKPENTPTARFILFRDAAKLIQVSGWWQKQTKARLNPFAEGDAPPNYSDPQPAGETASEAAPAAP